jgi:hypothetical protein
MSSEGYQGQIRGGLHFCCSIIQDKLGGDNNALLASNLEVLLLVPSLSTPAPSLPSVPSVAFLLSGGASRSQSSPFISVESRFRSSLMKRV